MAPRPLKLVAREKGQTRGDSARQPPHDPDGLPSMHASIPAPPSDPIISMTEPKPPVRMDWDCMVCSKAVSAHHACWQCHDGCFGVTHLECVQGYARDSMGVHMGASTSRLQPPGQSALVWGCPGCDWVYPRAAVPTQYVCFCGKELEPKVTGFAEPHTCGEVCGRRQTSCGHGCSMLCHRGPCPPCPMMSQVSCFCGNVSAVRRCGEPRFSCGSRCSKPLHAFWIEGRSDFKQKLASTITLSDHI